MVHNVGRQNLAALVVGDVALHDSYTGINDAPGGFLGSIVAEQPDLFETDQLGAFVGWSPCRNVVKRCTRAKFGSRVFVR